MLVRSVFNGVDSVKSAQFVSVTSLIIQKISVFTIDSTILSFSALSNITLLYLTILQSNGWINIYLAFLLSLTTDDDHIDSLHGHYSNVKRGM